MNRTNWATTCTIQRTQNGVRNQIAKQSGVWAFLSVSMEWVFLCVKTGKWKCHPTRKKLHVSTTYYHENQ